VSLIGGAREELGLVSGGAVFAPTQEPAHQRNQAAWTRAAP